MPIFIKLIEENSRLPMCWYCLHREHKTARADSYQCLVLTNKSAVQKAKYGCAQDGNGMKCKELSRMYRLLLVFWRIPVCSLLFPLTAKRASDVSFCMQSQLRCKVKDYVYIKNGYSRNNYSIWRNFQVSVLDLYSSAQMSKLYSLGVTKTSLISIFLFPEKK